MKSKPFSPQTLVTELLPIGRIFPEATKAWLAKLAWRIWQLEATGATHFGGPEILAWWLVQRCQPVTVHITKAKIRKLQRMAGGSQKTLNMLISMEQDKSVPARLRQGWDFLHLNSYLAGLKSERCGGYGG